MSTRTAAEALNDAFNDVDDSLFVSLKGNTATASTPTTLIKTVAASGTPEAIAASSTIVSKLILIGKKAARTNNTGIVYFGFTSTNDEQAHEIAAGAVVEFSPPNGQVYDLSDIYIDVATNGDGVVAIYS